MSKFNNDWLCSECKEDERAAPGYAAADAAEVAAVLAGVRNFPGVGLSPADRDFLAVRLVERGLEGK